MTMRGEVDGKARFTGHHDMLWGMTGHAGVGYNHDTDRFHVTMYHYTGDHIP